MAKKILQPFYTLYVLLTFIITVASLLPVFMVLGSGKSVRMRAALHFVVKTWASAWLWIIGMGVRVSGKQPQKGKYIVVVNHISYLDTLVIFPAIVGHFRPLGKKEISRIPVIGFIYKQIVIMVDRANAVSRAVSMRLMWRVLKREGSIVIFPEGTFNETGKPLKDFHNGAFRLAISTKTAIVPLLLPDTVERWHYSAWWKMWPGPNRAHFLPAITVDEIEMKQLTELKERVFSLMESSLVQLKLAKSENRD